VIALTSSWQGCDATRASRGEQTARFAGHARTWLRSVLLREETEHTSVYPLASPLLTIGSTRNFCASQRSLRSVATRTTESALLLNA
jgi:hypothetical protein